MPVLMFKVLVLEVITTGKSLEKFQYRIVASCSDRHFCMVGVSETFHYPVNFP